MNLFFFSIQKNKTNFFRELSLDNVSSNCPPNTDKVFQVPIWIWQASWAANDLIYLNSNRLSKFGRCNMKAGDMDVTNTWVLASLSKSDF